MPKEWYDRHSVNVIEDEDKRRFYRNILADKKPYFMRYIYPDVMKQYNSYIKNTNKNALREFQMTVDEMKRVPYSDLSERQIEFLRYYDSRMPVGIGDCVMNRICRRFESEFDGFVGKHSSDYEFDYSIMKSGSEYTKSQYTAVKRLCDEYTSRLQAYSIFSYYESVTPDDSKRDISAIRNEFIKEFDIACPSKETLCDIMIDICYRRSGTKKVVWDICCDQIIENLLNNNGRKISYIARDDCGDISYCGNTFSLRTISYDVEDEDGYSIE